MRKRSFQVAIVIVALLGLWVIFVSDSRSVPAPPTATFVSAEPSGMIDDSGAELLLVTFTINNPSRLEDNYDRAGSAIWVKEPAKPTEARIQNHWRTVPAASTTSTTFTLYAGQEIQSTLLALIGTDTCRVRLQYTGQRCSYPPTLKGISSSLAAKLPVSVRSRISYKFWRWAGFPRIGPDTKWREICVEFPVLPDLDRQLVLRDGSQTDLSD